MRIMHCIIIHPCYTRFTKLWLFPFSLSPFLLYAHLFIYSSTRFAIRLINKRTHALVEGLKLNVPDAFADPVIWRRLFNQNIVSSFNNAVLRKVSHNQRAEVGDEYDKNNYEAQLQSAFEVCVKHQAALVKPDNTVQNPLRWHTKNIALRRLIVYGYTGISTMSLFPRNPVKYLIAITKSLYSVDFHTTALYEYNPDWYYFYLIDCHGPLKDSCSRAKISSSFSFCPSPNRFSISQGDSFIKDKHALTIQEILASPYTRDLYYSSCQIRMFYPGLKLPVQWAERNIPLAHAARQKWSWDVSETAIMKELSASTPSLDDSKANEGKYALSGSNSKAALIKAAQAAAEFAEITRRIALSVDPTFVALVNVGTGVRPDTLDVDASESTTFPSPSPSSPSLRSPSGSSPSCYSTSTSTLSNSLSQACPPSTSGTNGKTRLTLLQLKSILSGDVLSRIQNSLYNIRKVESRLSTHSAKDAMLQALMYYEDKHKRFMVSRFGVSKKRQSRSAPAITATAPLAAATITTASATTIDRASSSSSGSCTSPVKNLAPRSSRSSTIPTTSLSRTRKGAQGKNTARNNESGDGEEDDYLVNQDEDALPPNRAKLTGRFATSNKDTSEYDNGDSDDNKDSDRDDDDDDDSGNSNNNSKLRKYGTTAAARNTTRLGQVSVLAPLWERERAKKKAAATPSRSSLASPSSSPSPSPSLLLPQPSSPEPSKPRRSSRYTPKRKYDYNTDDSDDSDYKDGNADDYDNDDDNGDAYSDIDTSRNNSRRNSMA